MYDPQTCPPRAIQRRPRRQARSAAQRVFSAVAGFERLTLRRIKHGHRHDAQADTGRITDWEQNQCPNVIRQAA
jgi:hypothetical protein